MTDLSNEEVTCTIEDRTRMYAVYSQDIRDQSSRRDAKFGHFITLHLILLPMHFAVINAKDALADSMVYSVLVAILGVIICLVSYRRISSSFARIDESYRLIHEVEKTLPYRFFTVLGERMKVKEGKERQSKFGRWLPRFRMRRTELSFHWIIGLIYVSLPVVHFNMKRIVGWFQ